MFDKIIEKAKQCVKIPYEYGHSDVGDVLIRLFKNEITELEALDELECLMQDYSNLQNNN